MAPFPQSFYGSADPSFTPLFRLLDDFDNYAREAKGSDSQKHCFPSQSHAAQYFTPRFDVRETDETYELHGELPGVERGNVNIEFTEPQTLAIHGRVERTYNTCATPGDSVANARQGSGAVPEHSEYHNTRRATPPKVTVEDDPEDTSVSSMAVSAPTPTTPETVRSSDPTTDQRRPPAQRCLVLERSVGHFSRTFSFPARVDQDNATASLDNGILSVIVPKAKKHLPRRILIN